MTVRETQVQDQTFGLQDSHGVSWLMQNVISIKHPLAKDRKLQACVALQKDLDKARRKVEEAEYETKTIEEEQKRLKGLIPVTHDADANDLKTEVAGNEKRWRELKRTTIPALNQGVREKEATLQEALAKLSVSWTEGDGNGAPAKSPAGSASPG